MNGSGMCRARGARRAIGCLALLLATTFLSSTACAAAEPPGPVQSPRAQQAAPAPQAEEPGESKPVVRPAEILSRYRFKGLPSRALDIRWAEKDSIFALTREHGVFEHRLEPGLPRLRRVLPGSADGPHLVGVNRLAVSADTVLAAAVNAEIWWAPRDPSRSHEQVRTGFREAGLMSDVDLLGDDLLLLGVPALPYKGTEDDLLRYHFWTARVEDDRLTEFEPFYEDPGAQDATEGGRRDDYLGGNTGSLRYSAKGDVFVYPGYRDEVWHLSAAGKLEKVWHLVDLGLGAARDKADEAAREGPNKRTPFKWSEWQAGSPLSVDDVVALGTSPCLVVRRFRDGAEGWYLVVLDGDDARWFSLPLARRWPMARLQADADGKGRIMILEGDRGTPETMAPDDQEIVVVSLPPD